MPAASTPTPAEPVPLEPAIPASPGDPAERSRVAWLAYLILQHVLWLIAALRNKPATLTKPPETST